MFKKLTLAFIPLVILACPLPSQARVNSISGGLNTGMDFDHRTEHNDGNSSGTNTSNRNRDYNTMSVTPSLRFTSKGIKDYLSLNYSLGLKYNSDKNSNNVDHHLNLSAQRSLTQNWQIRISDLYVKTDDATLSSTSVLPPQDNSTATTTLSTATNDTSATVSPVSNNDLTSPNAISNADQISSQLGRHRFWTNNASLSTEYTYTEGSVVSMGYVYSVLRNEESNQLGYQDYDKHTGSLSVSYLFNPEWKVNVGGRYVRGIYGAQTSSTLGSQRDLSEYHGNVTLNSYVFARSVLSLTYGYSGTRYDNADLQNNDIHQATIGWQHDVSPRLNFSLGGGPSYAKTEGQDANWGYNAHVRLNYAIEHGKLGVGVQKTFYQDNFTGTSTGGTIDTWMLNGDFNYQLYSDLSYSLFASYRDQDHQNPIVNSNTSGTSYKEKIYSTGLSLNYNFWHWFTATAGYTFSRQESDSDLALGYDEHRVYVTVGAGKEFWRW